ncbi:hypothetical protein AGMMS49949_02870 [Alphaproteobacteria bacterium]|nr:hypothetical protein AGMMS49949_02870 [Alphaproteobacteria bacterium]GHS95553.1 hypothetical protein AGMMS50296_0070 [Alphaproteobacteria bacterium]
MMLHRAVLGSLERFIGILIEQYAGAFPVWLTPVQAVVVTITEDANGAAQSVVEKLRQQGLRAELDARNETLSYKVREHSLQKIPYVLVVGRKEAADGTVTVRKLGTDAQQTVPVDEFVERLVDEGRLP